MVSTSYQSSLPKNAAQGKKFAIVVSQYHEEITKELLQGALDTLEAYGADPSQIATLWVPGSFEIPLAARAIAQQQSVDAIIGLGVIVKGETPHNEYIAKEVAHGIAQIGHQTGIPVIFGVLTPETLEQGKARAGGNKGHKGVEAAEAAIAMIQILEQIKKGATKPQKNVGF